MDIKDAVEKLSEQSQRDIDADLRRVKAVLRLDEKRDRAQERCDLIARRAKEFSDLVKQTTISARHRAIILQARPGLQRYFDAVDVKQDRLHDLTFGTQSRLSKAIRAEDALTPEDLIPQKWEHLILTPLGEVAPVVWGLYEKLGNIPPAADIDEAVTHLKTAFAELTERLGTVVASLQPSPRERG